MSPASAGVLCGAVVVAAVSVLLPAARRTPRPARPAVPSSARQVGPGAARWLPAVVGVLLALAGLDWLGLLTGVGLAVVLPRLLAATADPGEVRTRADVRREAPAAIDLLAAALAAGAGPEVALASVGRVLDGPLGARLAATAASLALGGDPEQAWRPALAGGGEALGPVADAFLAAEIDGSTLIPRLERLAAEAREVAAAAALTAAERAGVRAVAPLGLCFLPAFVAVGIVPVVASALRTVPW